MKDIDFKIHVLISSLIVITLMIVGFLSDNPIILLSIFVFCGIILGYTKNWRKFKNGFIYFIPFLIMSAIINFLFVQEGRIVLFEIGNRIFTLESFIYSIIFSLKLLLIIYEFMILQILIDSDRAISYFSNKMPKTTLLIMIGMKFFPIMRERIVNLKNTYKARGIDFEDKTLKSKIKAYVPVLSILLENSLEGAFDIGEAAYVRGFLSGKRSVYDRQKFIKKDYIILIQCSFIVAFTVISNLEDLIKFDIYGQIYIKDFLNLTVIIISISILIMGITSVLNVSRME